MTQHVERYYRRHRSEAGLTLIELIVTMAVMSAGLVGLLAAFSTVELTVNSTTGNAELATQARAVGDYLESSSVAYTLCEPASGSDYTSALSGFTLPPGYKTAISSVAQANGGNHTVSGLSSSLSPINGCAAGPGPDYGVQQIAFTVSNAKQSLSRVVYKRWNS